jgi:hypothetical protein
MSLYAIVYDDNGSRKFCHADGTAYFGFDRAELTKTCAELIKEMKWQLDGSPVTIQGFLSCRVERTGTLTPETQARYNTMLESISVVKVTEMSFDDGVELPEKTNE